MDNSTSIDLPSDDFHQQSELAIRDITLGDYGTYSVTATNEFGTMDVIFYLNPE